jgi:hypothetical protein
MTRFGKSKRGTKGRCYPAFVPTEAQRKLVAQLISLHVTWTEIQQLIINPHNGEPVCRQTLAKAFRRELAAGGARLKELAASKYFAALEAGGSWAIRLAMRNRFNWCMEGSNLLPADHIGQSDNEGIALQINFVTPTKKPEPINITPPETSPYRDAKPDYDRPAIEPPRPRYTTGTGAVWEPPRKPTDWMG